MIEHNTAKRKDWPMSYVRACMAFGNGDAGKGRQVIFMLARRLEEARGGLKRLGKSIPCLPKAPSRHWVSSVLSSGNWRWLWSMRSRTGSSMKPWTWPEPLCAS